MQIYRLYRLYDIYIPFPDSFNSLMIVDCLIARIYLDLVEAVMYTEEVPGHDEVKFVHPLSKRTVCPICLHAMRSPVQTECGHLFCKECLDPVLQRRRPVCPLDHEPISQYRVSHSIISRSL